MTEDYSLRPVEYLKEFVGKDPSGLPAFLSSLTTGGTYFRGTTIRAIQPGFTQLPNSLIVPASYARPAQPIDQMRTFLTCDEIFGVSPPIEYAYGELRRISTIDAIANAAYILRALRQPGISHADCDLQFANSWFTDPTRTRVVNLLRNSNRALAVPQAALKLVQLALLHSPPSISPGTTPGNFIAALLVVTDHLGPNSVDKNSSALKDVPGGLGREIIANQIFNAQVHEPHSLSRFIRTWLQLPVERKDDSQVIDIEAAFFQHAGVKLRDLIAVGVALWTGAVQQGPHIKSGYYRHSALSADRYNSALSLIGATIPELRKLIKSEVEQGSVDWAFDTFNRFPVVRVSNEDLIVLDPDLLMRRVFGWITLFDIENGNADVKSSKAERRKHIEQVRSCLRHLAEVYTGEVLDSLAPSLPGSPRVFHDHQLKKAYSATRVQVADAAIDYGDAWVVVETTTTHLRRESAKGKSDSAVVADLEKFVDEARQIDSTISCLREKEQDLTGSAPTCRKRFYPLIVATEGFPTSPVTTTLLRNMVHDENLLSQSDTMPLEVVDITELEMIEGVQTGGGPNLRQILDGKARAGLALCAMHQYILMEARLNAVRSPRVQRLFTESVNTAIQELFPGMPLLPIVDGEPLG